MAIVNFIPTGMIPMKESVPDVPISAIEIIEQVHEAYELGDVTHPSAVIAPSAKIGPGGFTQT